MLGYNPLPAPTINVSPSASIASTASTSTIASTASTASTASAQSGSLDSILGTLLQGAQVVGAIKYQREQSGAAADRQARIAQCGKRPIFGKSKKEAYQKCIADANKPLPNILENVDNENKNLGGGSSMKFVYIGLGVLALGGIAYLALKKK